MYLIRDDKCNTIGIGLKVGFQTVFLPETSELYRSI